MSAFSRTYLRQRPGASLSSAGSFGVNSAIRSSAIASARAAGCVNQAYDGELTTLDTIMAICVAGSYVINSEILPYCGGEVCAQVIYKPFELSCGTIGSMVNYN